MLWLALCSPASSRAQERGRAERPLLEQLNRETQALYDEALQGLVRVQLPTPAWASPVAQREELLKRWPNLRAEVKRELAKQAAGGGGVDRPAPATQRGATGEREGQLATDEAEAEAADARGSPETVVVVPGPADRGGADPEREAMIGGRLAMAARAAGSFDPNNIGLLLDDAGHVLVPLFVERSEAERAGIRAAGPDGVVRPATFVGSDRQTNITVLKLNVTGTSDPAFNGSPVRLSRQRPADGSVVLYIEPHTGSGRLGVWTGAATDLGIVFLTGGDAAGIARYGQFLNAPACRLIADQIIRHGKVRRATLGVIISEIRQDDPLRRRVPVLGSRTAMRVEQVIRGSAAERANLRAGDLLLSLAGEAVGDIPSLAAAIASRSGKTELQVLRDGEVLEVTVELKRE